MSNNLDPLCPANRSRDGVRNAVHSALGRVAYQHLDRDRLADVLVEALTDGRAFGDDAAFAAGARTALDVLDTVRLPAWATFFKPLWFRDFQAARELLLATAISIARGDQTAIRQASHDIAFRKALADIR